MAQNHERREEKTVQLEKTHEGGVLREDTERHGFKGRGNIDKQRRTTVVRYQASNLKPHCMSSYRQHSSFPLTVSLFVLCCLRPPPALA